MKLFSSKVPKNQWNLRSMTNTYNLIKKRLNKFERNITISSYTYSKSQNVFIAYIQNSSSFQVNTLYQHQKISND